MNTYMDIREVEGGYMLTAQKVVANRIVSAQHLFNSVTDAMVYGERYYA